jgi:hypothetical protein
VDLAVEGTPGPLAPSVDLTAYRIIQEALTNTVRHAHAARALVTVCYEPGFVTVSVTDTRCDGGIVPVVNGSPGHASPALGGPVLGGPAPGGPGHAGPVNGMAARPRPAARNLRPGLAASAWPASRSGSPPAAATCRSAPPAPAGSRSPPGCPPSRPQ